MSQRERKKMDGGDGRSRMTRRERIHHSGLRMPRSLFVRLDRIIKHVAVHSRGELLALSLTIILDMCEDPTKRYLPPIIALYDKRRPPIRVEPDIDTLSGAKYCGTHFDRILEERIAAIARPIRWSRNQFIIEAVNTIVLWCEDPDTRTVPLVALLYDTALSSSVQIKLKNK